MILGGELFPRWSVSQWVETETSCSWPRPRVTGAAGKGGLRGGIGGALFSRRLHPRREAGVVAPFRLAEDGAGVVHVPGLPPGRFPWSPRRRVSHDRSLRGTSVPDLGSSPRVT